MRITKKVTFWVRGNEFCFFGNEFSHFGGNEFGQNAQKKPGQFFFFRKVCTIILTKPWQFYWRLMKRENQNKFFSCMSVLVLTSKTLIQERSLFSWIFTEWKNEKLFSTIRSIVKYIGTLEISTDFLLNCVQAMALISV